MGIRVLVVGCSGVLASCIDWVLGCWVVGLAAERDDKTLGIGDHGAGRRSCRLVSRGAWGRAPGRVECG